MIEVNRTLMIAYGYWRQKLVSCPRHNPMKTYRRGKCMPEAKIDDTLFHLRQLLDRQTIDGFTIYWRRRNIASIGLMEERNLRFPAAF